MTKHLFSSVYGENLTLDKHSLQAKWDPKRSGGWIFSASPLEAGQEIKVMLNGSGHCEVGVIKTDPCRCDLHKDPAQFKKLNGIQIHKMKCSIPVCRNREGNEIKSEHQGDVFKKSVNKKTSVWIAVYVKFGEVSAELIDEKTGKLHFFSETQGTNIRLDTGRRRAMTINSNPAALCFVGSAIHSGETIKVTCEPLRIGSKKPSRFHLKLLVCHKNPDGFLTDFKSAFDTSVQAVSDPPVTVLEILEKGECDGTVCVTLDKSLHMRYVSATNKQNNQTLNFDASKGVWIGFELYRVVISLQSTKTPNTKNIGFDEPDARIREPMNEDAENTMDPFNSFVNRLQNQRTEQVYVSEDKADLQTRNRTMVDKNMVNHAACTIPIPNTKHSQPYVTEDKVDLQTRNRNMVDKNMVHPATVTIPIQNSARHSQMPSNTRVSQPYVTEDKANLHIRRKAIQEEYRQHPATTMKSNSEQHNMATRHAKNTQGYVLEERAGLLAQNKTKLDSNISQTAPSAIIRPKLPEKLRTTHTNRNHIYQNIDEKMKPTTTNGYVQNPPDKFEGQTVDHIIKVNAKPRNPSFNQTGFTSLCNNTIDMHNTNHNTSTVHKSKSISRPIQIPAPKQNITAGSANTKPPLKIKMELILHQTEQGPIFQEIPLHQDIPSNIPTSNAEGSLIVSHLSIERADSKSEASANQSNKLNEQPMNATLSRVSSESNDPKNDFIQKNWTRLVESVCADKLCDHLYQQCYIRDDERQSITDLYKNDPQPANRRLMQLIMKRRISLSSLVKIFKDAELGYLVGNLDCDTCQNNKF